MKKSKQIINQNGGFVIPFLQFVVVVFLFVQFLKVVPIYIDHNEIKEELSFLTKNAEARSIGDEKLKELFKSHLKNINSSKDISDFNFRIERNGKEYSVSLDYEEKINLMDNVSLVIHFNPKSSTNNLPANPLSETLLKAKGVGLGE